MCSVRQRLGLPPIADSFLLLLLHDEPAQVGLDLGVKHRESLHHLSAVCSFLFDLRSCVAPTFSSSCSCTVLASSVRSSNSSSSSSLFFFHSISARIQSQVHSEQKDNWAWKRDDFYKVAMCYTTSPLQHKQKKKKQQHTNKLPLAYAKLLHVILCLYCVLPCPEHNLKMQIRQILDHSPSRIAIKKPETCTCKCLHFCAVLQHSCAYKNGETCFITYPTKWIICLIKLSYFIILCHYITSQG